jgi:hypothetical protein
MRRIKGGVHCQRMYRESGWHPLENVGQAMAKRQQRVPGVGSQGARERAAITPGLVRKIPRISSLLEEVDGGMGRITEALRFSPEQDAMAFLRKYDSMSDVERERLSIKELCLAAGIAPQRFLNLALTSMIENSLLVTKLMVASNLVAVMQKTIDSALTDKGARDRKLFFECCGFLPFFIEVQGSPRNAAPQPNSDEW